MGEEKSKLNLTRFGGKKIWTMMAVSIWHLIAKTNLPPISFKRADLFQASLKLCQLAENYVGARTPRIAWTRSN